MNICNLFSTFAVSDIKRTMILSDTAQKQYRVVSDS